MGVFGGVKAGRVHMCRVTGISFCDSTWKVTQRRIPRRTIKSMFPRAYRALSAQKA